MKSESRPKVICIGWHKTGTSTLGLALIELGYSVVGARLDLEDCLRKQDIRPALRVASQFGALQDVPWALLYRELDKAFPSSKFVFTDRDDADWLRSAVGHFGDKYYSMHEWIYGDGRCVGNEELYLERFRRHRLEVRRYFADRPQDFLEMDLNRGDGWEKLCEFLGCAIPRKPWPHTNKGKHNFDWRDRTADALRRIAPIRLRRLVFGIKLRIRLARGLPDPRNRFNNFEENRRSGSSHTGADETD